MEVNPLSVILVKSDSKGDRLLFRYPFSTDNKPINHQKLCKKNPYALIVNADSQSPPLSTSNISQGYLTGLTDEVLSKLFAVKPELYERKFELKVNDVRFVGHPTLFHSGILDRSERNPGSIQSLHGQNLNYSDMPSAILVNTVFALHSYASHSIVKCYYDLSRRIGIALKHEERRCYYVSNQTKVMIAAHDEIAQKLADTTDKDCECPFELILHRSSLAIDLKKIFDDLCSTGLVHVRINRWIEVSFCLPHKVHQIPYTKKGLMVEPHVIDKCLESIRPYHGLLLLVDPQELLQSSPPDSSPALLRLIQVYSPLKSFQTLAADADVTLTHIFQLTGHMVYWAQAMVIYPLCENNIYVVAPDAPTHVSSPLINKFSERFSGENLLQLMSEFSLPTSLNQKLSPLTPQTQQLQLIQIIAWMLQHKLLVQLHTYVHLMPGIKGHSVGVCSKISNQRSTPKELCSKSHEDSYSSEPTQANQYSSKSELTILKSIPITSLDDAKESFIGKFLTVHFNEEERENIFKIPASSNSSDLLRLVELYEKGYLTGKYHLEEIMYSFNMKRCELLQVLDKFRDVLVLCEIEDSAISIFYPHYKS